MEKRWNIRPPSDEALVENLSKVLNVRRVFAELLLQRGITTYDEAKAFFRPKLTDQHNPFLLKDMEHAVSRITLAINRNERILVYGDYDVDGTTAVALVYSFLRLHYNEQNLDFYIPDRYDEGYGISYKGINYAEANNISLVIALDCGIKAVEKVKYANERNIDFIICDHHTPGETLPEAVACIDPKREDCQYPDKNLSGCGVGFKLMQAFCRRFDYNEDDLNKHLDLLAVSIASDIVPIIGENRILAFHGLKQINENPSVGLKSIIKVAGLGKQITISDIIFKIGPRINAAGRMNSGMDAVSLLISETESKADQISQEIEASNEERKDLDRKITLEALDIIKNNPKFLEGHSTVLFHENWHKGVVGIVASRLTETYYRPTIVLTESKGLATGSARSIDGFDLYKAIESCSDLLENFGGHMYAAGLTMKLENVEAFTERFEKYVSENIQTEQLIPQIDVDTEIHLPTIDEKFLRLLEQFEPFGPCNTRPVFISRNVSDRGHSRSIGKDHKHLKLEVIDNYGRVPMQGIGFGLGEYIDKIKNGESFDICYTVEENEYPPGQKNIQLNVKDIHLNH